jgi:hypothetical protein
MRSGRSLAFGEQLQRSTNGKFTTTHVLASTAIACTMQSILGAQVINEWQRNASPQ